ncbi:MAG: hypothetical protein B6D61_00880 [Bacteroidetes bacterium 4484_249]|nr:MAG: hypothetical protein B6D61_00880 [Bacteroidetes bacterium 4484_249]
MLSQRKHPLLNQSRYREIFTFPVKDYYIKAGFNFSTEPFDKIAMEFIGLYHNKLKDAVIFPEVISVLKAFKKNNIRQIMISAMEHKSLIKSVKEKAIFDYFSIISGIDNHYAASKTDNAKKIVSELNLDLSKTCLIGDTLHDYEVANELGVCCLLIANGHQTYERLSKSGCEVVKNLDDTIRYFGLNHFETNTIKTK